MRAIQVTRLDGPDAVELKDVADPATADDSVIIDVHAAGVAFPDALLSRGRYQYKPALPFVPGGEVAGVVRRAPEGAHVAAGDRVLGLTLLTGGMAEVVALPPDRVFALPDNVSFEAGAGVLFNDLTVHFALRTRGRLRSGETVLVHGAAGGIGTSTLRLAPALGASRTIAVVSAEDKIDIARSAGATDVVLADGFKDAVATLTDGKGVDIVMDPVGGDRFTDSLRSLAAGGRLLVVGFTGGEIPTVKVNRLLLNNIDAVGVGWGAWALSHPGSVAQQWAELEPLLASGALPAPQPQVYPLERAGEAIASLENRSARGKVVLALRS
jgi:NADPH2:quinone reductase